MHLKSHPLSIILRAIPSNSEDSEKSFRITQKSHPC